MPAFCRSQGDKLTLAFANPGDLEQTGRALIRALETLMEKYRDEPTTSALVVVLDIPYMGGLDADGDAPDKTVGDVGHA